MMPSLVGQRARKAAIGSGFALVAATAAMLIFAAEPETTGRKFFGLWSTRWIVFSTGCMAIATALFAWAHSRHAYMAYLAAMVSTFAVWGALDVLGVAGIVSYRNLLDPRDAEALGTKPAPNIEQRGFTRQDTSTTWGLPSDPIPYHYATNSIGYRNHPGRESADIYILGDSIVVSPLLPYDQTLTARLEGSLGYRIALIGISPRKAQQLFRETELPVKGKLVLQVIFEGNDLADLFYESRQPAAEPLLHRTLTYQTILFIQRLTQPVVGLAKRRSCKIDGQLYTFFYARESFLGYESETSVLETALRHFAAEVRNAGGTFKVVYVPTKLRVLSPVCTFPPAPDSLRDPQHLNPLRDRLKAWASESGIDMLDVTEELTSAARARRIPWFWGDTHPNAIGHEVMADAVAKWLLASSLERKLASPPQRGH